MLATPDWCRLMARYNAWQNKDLLRLVTSMPEGEATRDRGAFWGSTLGTLSHLAYGDRMWLHRFTGSPRPEGPLADSGCYLPTVEAWVEARVATDALFTTWTAGLTDTDVEGDLTWTSTASSDAVFSKPRGLLLVHVFNHQTHHRGQVHAMLTAAGLAPGITDLAFQPD